MRLSAAGCRIEDQEIIIHIFIHLHDTCLVCASVTVVRCREDSDDVLIVTPIETIHDELMCARNKLQIVHMIELLRNVLSESVSGTSW